MDQHRETLEKFEARIEEKGSKIRPLDYGDPSAELSNLRKTAVWVDRSFHARLKASGPDSLEYLNGLFTNDVRKVDQGEVVFGFFLNRHGRIVFESRIAGYDDGLLLYAPADDEEDFFAHLDKYHFSEDLELSPAGESTAQIVLAGPKAVTYAGILFPEADLPGPGKFVQTTFDGAPMTIAWNQETAESGFELVFPMEKFHPLAERLASIGVRPAGASAWEQARIEAGVPAAGAELTGDVIPLEAGLRDTAFSFTKGCYIGQEIIARIDAKGEPAKRLVGFSVDGPLPAPGTPVMREGKEVGKVTSSVVSQSLRQRPIAMGYVRKDVDERASDLTAGDAKMWIVPRPFYPPQH